MSKLLNGRAQIEWIPVSLHCGYDRGPNGDCETLEECLKDGWCRRARSLPNMSKLEIPPEVMASVNRFFEQSE